MSKIIDADILMENLNGDIAAYSNAGHDLNIYKWLQDYLSSSVYDDDWINIKDRLPEESGQYLVSINEDGDEEHQAYSYVISAWYNPSYWPFSQVGWTLLNEFYDLTPRLREKITHWKPWPEPADM